MADDFVLIFLKIFFCKTMILTKRLKPVLWKLSIGAAPKIEQEPNFLVGPQAFTVIELKKIPWHT